MEKEYNLTTWDLLTEEQQEVYRIEQERLRPKRKYLVLGLFHYEGGGGTDALLGDFDTVKQAYEWILNNERTARPAGFLKGQLHYHHEIYEIVELASFSLVAEFDTLNFNQTGDLQDDPFFGASMWKLKEKGLLN